MFFSGILFAFGYAAKFIISRLRNKGKVWMMLTLRHGGIKLKRVKVSEEGKIVTTKYGTFYALSEADEGPYTARGDLPRQFFRFKEENPFPYRHGEKQLRTEITREEGKAIATEEGAKAAANGGVEELLRTPKEKTLRLLRRESFDEIIPLSPKFIKTRFRTHDYEDTYSNRRGLLMFLAVMMFILILLGIAQLIQR